MNRKVFSIVLMLVPALAFSQEDGSAAAVKFSADAQNRAIESQMAWEAAKKITLLKSVPKEVPTQDVDFSKAEEGWVGELSFWNTEVLSIKSDKEMLLKIAKEVIWLVNYPTKDFTSGQKVRVVGPVKAGPTRPYLTVGGSERTVRTFTLVDGEALVKYQENQKQEQSLASIKKTIQEIIWGELHPIATKSLDRRQLKQYKEELEQVGRYIKASKITASLSSPMTFDAKKKRIEFDSEESKTLALDHLKSLSADIPK